MFRTKKSKTLPEISTTSLPDIIFMLLFFFMVVTVLRKNDSDLKLNLPSVAYAELIKDKNQVAIAMKMSAGRPTYYIGTQTYQDLPTFEKGLLNQGPDLKRTTIKLVMDREIPMSAVNEVKSSLQRCELYSVEYLVNDAH